jgi:hypothetical protein
MNEGAVSWMRARFPGRGPVAMELGLSASQHASLARLLQSRLDVSVASLLRE